MKYFSMFSGIGGFELGIQQAYDNLRPIQSQDNERPEELNSSKNELQQWECVGYSEIDKYAIQIYERHFNHKNYGDATTINPSELPDFDLLVGGFPCQAFSIAGKRGGLNDTRGTLFYDIARIAKEKRPQHLLLENVKGLLSHDNGRTFKLIISTFAELGYNLEWQVLNSKNLGVPQNRERVFIIGHSGACCGRQVFPIRQNDIISIERQGQISPTITARYFKQGQSDPYVITDRPSDIRQLNNPTHSNDRVYGADGISPTLNTVQGGNRQPFISEEMRIRRLTPTECERLQGYPDGWTEGISNTQRYKTLGNSISVPVVEYLIKQLFNV